jgi:hypothetical protein
VEGYANLRTHFRPLSESAAAPPYQQQMITIDDIDRTVERVREGAQVGREHIVVGELIWYVYRSLCGEDGHGQAMRPQKLPRELRPTTSD